MKITDVKMENYCSTYNNFVSRGWDPEVAESYTRSICDACPYCGENGCIEKDVWIEDVQRVLNKRA